MPRIDRLLPPVAIKITDYDAEYMETHHKRTYKSFLAMRQHIGTEFEANADQRIVEDKIYYERYNLLLNIAEGTPGHEIMKWHGMTDEGIQEIINLENEVDLARLAIAWTRRTLFDTTFFASIEDAVAVLISRRYGTWFDNAIESDLVQPQPLTNEENAVWDIYFALNLFNIIDIDGEFALEENVVSKLNIISIAEERGTIPGDLDRAAAGLSILLGADGIIFQMTEPAYGQYLSRDTLLSKENFETISQDNFFDIYTENIFIDWKEDTNWFERFIGGLFRLIGEVLNLILDILLGTPLFGEVLEWIIEGVAGLFSMTLEEARAAVIQAIVFLVALYLTVPSEGSSLYAYIEYASSAFSLGGFAGDIAAATNVEDIPTIEELEAEETRRELEKMRGELSATLGQEEPYIRLNRPTEELRVDGNNNSTYNIFKLD